MDSPSRDDPELGWVGLARATVQQRERHTVMCLSFGFASYQRHASQPG